MKKKYNPECEDFEICSENSDAECFLNEIYPCEEFRLISVTKRIKKNPSLCDICVYNKKHKGMGWKKWKKFRKQIGIQPKN
jgi:hypothetical protein